MATPFRYRNEKPRSQTQTHTDLRSSATIDPYIVGLTLELWNKKAWKYLCLNRQFSTQNSSRMACFIKLWKFSSLFSSPKWRHGKFFALFHYMIKHKIVLNVYFHTRIIGVPPSSVWYALFKNLCNPFSNAVLELFYLYQ